MRKFTPILCVLFFIGACASSGEDGGGDDDPPPPAPVCGDGTCASTEVGVCQDDCGGGNPNNPVCGNGSCENGENSTTCAQDCPPAGPVCGDSNCDMAGGENSTNCPGDCGGGGGSLDCNDFAVLFACLLCTSDPTQCVPPANPTDCAACTGGGGFSFCEGMAPDGVCNPAAGEDVDTCPEDCP